jgi:hypothetical protein
MDKIESNSSWSNSEKAIAAFIQSKEYEEAKNILIKELKAAQVSGQLPSNLTQLVHELAAIYCLERRYKEAEQLYSEGFATREKILGPNHPDTIDSLERLAAVVRETQGNGLLAKTMAFRAHSLAKAIKAV